MQRSWGHELWRRYSTVFVVVILLALRLLLGLLRVDVGATALSAKLTYLGFFVWVDLAFTLLAAQLFSLLQGDESATDKGLTVFATAMYAGGLVGGILASSINSLLVDFLHIPFDIARDHLIIPMAAVLLLLLLLPAGRTQSAAPVTARTQEGLPESTHTIGIADQSGTIQHALRTLTGDRHARLVSMAFAFAAASAICLDSLFYWILSEQSAGGGGFVHLLAMLGIWMNGVSLLLAAGGASRLIRHLGLGVVVLAVPACLLIGSGYLLLATALFVMLGMRVLKDSLSSGLYEPASERLLVRLQGTGYSKQRPIFDVASRIGMGLGALLVLLLTLLLHVPLRVLIAVVVLLHLAWLAVLIPLARWVHRPALARL
jgi:ATP/ADP translocase